MFIEKFGAKDGTEIIIRSLVKSDIKRSREFVSLVNSVVIENDFIARKSKTTAVEEEKRLAESLKLIGKKYAVYLIAERDNSIIGTCNALRMKDRFEHVAVMGIILENKYRRLGIGTKLINLSVNSAGKNIKGIKILRLSCMDTNKAAIELYKKAGFSQVARIPKQLQRKGKLVDELIFLKTV